MKATTAALLARPNAGAGRGRFLMIAASTATAAALLLAGARIARLHVPDEEHPPGGIAPYLAQSGLRPGTVAAIVLLTVPILILALQALRVGSVARDRRMAALRLAGATPRDIRAISAVEAGGAALVGGLLAGWVYVLLWLVVGAALPSGARLLPAPDALDLPSWALVTLLAGGAGALAGALVERRVNAQPLGVFRRARSSVPGRGNLAVIVAGVAIMVLGSRLLDEYEGVFLIILGLLLAAVAGGSLLVRLSVRHLLRRGGPDALIAGWRLRAEPGSAGRVAGVLIVCGIALDFMTAFIAEMVADGTGGTAFYFGGTALAGGVTVVAAGVAVLTLVVGAGDQLLDARRPIATLAAMGVEEALLLRVLSRQLAAVAVPAVVVGVLVGFVASSLLFPGGIGLPLAFVVLAVVNAIVASFVVSAVARLAARLLRPQLRAALAPENLRTG